LWKKTFPGDDIPWSNLAEDHASLGEFGKAQENAQQAIRLNPDSRFAYRALAWAYLGLNHLDEAKAVLRTALERKLGGPREHIPLAIIALAEGNTAAFERESAYAKGTADEGWSLLQRGLVAASHGRIRQAEELSWLAAESDQHYKLIDFAAMDILNIAHTNALIGAKTRVPAQVDKALSFSKSPDVLAEAAAVLAMAGQEKRALEIINQLLARRPDDTLLQEVTAPRAKAWLEINHGNGGKAVELLEIARRWSRVNFDVLFARSTAYLKAGRSAEAVQEFRNLLELRRLGQFRPTLLSFAQLGLARAYALQGDSAKARTAYQDFFALWKDADPDIPILKEAKSEYAKLQ